MGELSEELTLDVTPALAAVDDVEAALVAAIASFGEGLAEQIQSVDVSPVADAFATIDVSSVREGLEAEAAAGGQAITEAVEAGAAAAQPSVEITDVDASAVSEGIEEVLAGADTTISIGVEGAEEAAQSVGELTQGLEETAGTAEEAGGGIGSFTTEALAADRVVKGLDKTTRGATNELGGLGFKALSTKTVLGTLVVTAGASAKAAFDAEAATQRYATTFGVLGGEIEDVDIAGLTTDLGTLALQTGSSDDRLRQALATFGQFGQAAGGSGPQIRGTGEDLLVLSNYVAALNPELGTADENFSGLTNALAKGGPKAQAYGLQLSSVEVQARAAEIAAADMRTEVTRLDLITAGAQITIARLGPRIKEGIEEGSKNAAVQVRSLKEGVGELAEELGQPFVEPAKQAVGGLLSLLKGLQDEVADTNTSLVDMATSGLPFVGSLSRQTGVLIRGLSADWTNNEDATLAVIEAQAKLPGPFGEAARAALEERDAILADIAAKEEGSKATAKAAEQEAALVVQLAAVGLTLDQIGGKQANITGISEAVNAMVAETVAGVPSATKAFGDFASETEINLNRVLEQFTKQTQAQAAFFENVKIIIRKGGADTALAIQALGPEQGAAFAAAVASATPAQIKALEGQTDARNRFIGEADFRAGQNIGLAMGAGANSTLSLEAARRGGKAVGDSAATEAGKTAPAARKAGEAIGEGVAQGIESKGPRGASAAQSFGLKVRRALEDFFRLGSPSRLTYGFGGDIGEGLALGILSSRRQVELAARSLASSVALPALSPAVPAAAAAPSQGASEAGVVGTAGTSIGELHVHEAPDPRGTVFRVSTEIARESQR